MCEEKHKNLGDPTRSSAVEVSEADYAGELKMSWESDQLIVLSERESRLQGEGADVDTKPTKETLTWACRPKSQCQPP